MALEDVEVGEKAAGEGFGVFAEEAGPRTKDEAEVVVDVVLDLGGEAELEEGGEAHGRGGCPGVASEL